MKITLRLILSLLLGSALVVFLFSTFQTRIEEKKLDEDLKLRGEVLVKTFKEALEPFLEQTESPSRIKQFIEKFKGRVRLIGIEVYLKDVGLITLPEELSEKKLFEQELRDTADQGQALEVKGRWGELSVSLETMPLTKQGEVVGSVGLIHDRTYIVRRIKEFQKNTAFSFSFLALILSLTTLLIVRWNVTGPISKIADWAKRARMDEIPQVEPFSMKEKGEIEKLLFEVMHMASSLKATRSDLREKSQQVESQNSVWSKEKLTKYLRAKLNGTPIFVISNREPYIHQKNKEGRIECIFPASGVVTALDPVLQATGGMWIAHGGGNADRETVDPESKVPVPPENPAYTLKRVWLTEEEEKGYYYGFSNEGLWPLCHISHTRPVFNIQDWEQYQKVNQKFADALLKELGDTPPIILIQDYHFALLPQMIKKDRPDAKISLFWHIPWPNAEAFGICPWQEELLDGMLGCDLIGFHTQFHCNNFLDTVDRALESRIDWTVFGVSRGGKTTYVKPFPISIAFPQSENILKADPKEILKRLRLEGKKIGVGVDRIDYTKGLLERFRSVERTLEKYPQYRGNLVFVELGAPSRTLIPGYQRHLQDVEELVRKINEKFGTDNYQPILFLKDHHAQSKIQDFYRLADFCLVSSLHDGMNLVAKEFVASREDESGVLILSRFAGASQELKSALLINPYDIEGSSDAIHQALTMLPEEKQERMRRMRSLVQEYNVYRWAAKQITELVKAF